MQNDSYWGDNVRVGNLPASGGTALAPLPMTGPVNSDMLLAAADPNTRQRITNAALLDQGRALLAFTAMENTVMLSAIEAHCCCVAPNGAHRYRLIADTYAVSAAKRIAGWM
jgi:hypothetical protein